MERPRLLAGDDAPEPQTAREAKRADSDDAELIFVGVEHRNEDAELIFVGVTSRSKPVVSNILNRVTPGSCLRRKTYGHLRRDAAPKLPPVGRRAAAPAAGTGAPPRDSGSGSAQGPVVVGPSPKPGRDSGRPVAPPGPAGASPALAPLPGPRRPGAALSAGGERERHAPQQPPPSEVNGEHPKRAKLSGEATEGPSSAPSPSGAVRAVAPSAGLPAPESLAGTGAPAAAAPPEDRGPVEPVGPEGGGAAAAPDPRGLAGADSAAEPRRESLVVLLSDFYYGQQGGHAPPEHKTHTVFKCLSCAKVLKNVKFMNHVKHHLDLEKQRSDGWESQAACPHCHRPFPSPSQLQRHVESVHAAPGPAAVCRICELAFQTDRALLEHMRASHKPGEMPYVCQACGFRSSVFADVDTHFRASHENTKNLLCPFCLKIFKTASPYMCHYRGHWERSAHQCSRCRLQFLTFKEKMEHKTQRHQTVRQPRQLEGLPPETRVVIQVAPGRAPGPAQAAAVTVSTWAAEPPAPGPGADARGAGPDPGPASARASHSP